MRDKTRTQIHEENHTVCRVPHVFTPETATGTTASKRTRRIMMIYDYSDSPDVARGYQLYSWTITNHF